MRSSRAILSKRRRVPIVVSRPIKAFRKGTAMNLLHIDSSVLGEQSASRALSAAIVARLRAQQPALHVAYRDLAAQSLPHFTPLLATSDPCARRNAEVLDEFLAADIVVIGAPMYNFSIPSQLKAWIDRILIAGKTFRYAENGPEGLAGGKRVIIASARGGMYSEGAAKTVDFQENYLRHVFGFIGITDVEFVRAEGLALSAGQRETALRHAHEVIEAGIREAA
jgi:FMN-dependent NADH-azoreductase